MANRVRFYLRRVTDYAAHDLEPVRYMHIEAEVPALAEILRREQACPWHVVGVELVEERMAMNDLNPERLAELRRNDEVAQHDGDCLYRLKSDYSLDYWRRALEGAFKECERIERTLGLPPDVHTKIYTRLKQWESLLNWLEEVRDDD